MAEACGIESASEAIRKGKMAFIFAHEQAGRLEGVLDPQEIDDSSMRMRTYRYAVSIVLQPLAVLPVAPVE